MRLITRRLASVKKLPPWTYLVAFVGMLVRYWWAATVPLGNDEVYYWDWGRDLQLSYIDHPPGVSWIASVGTWLDLPGPLGARLLVPLLHAVASLLILPTARHVKNSSLTRDDLLLWMLTTQLVPIFSLGGFFLVPDAGLMCALTLVAWVGARCVTRRRNLKFVEGSLWGAAWGLAGLFKYMALPLAMGGMLCVFLMRRPRLRYEWPFWLALFVTSLAVVWPVFQWNRDHDFASFRFQGSHGFAGSHFQIITAFRFLAGWVLMLSPWWAWIACLEFLRRASPRAKGLGAAQQQQHGAGLFLCWCFVPLFTLMVFQSFFKQLLPHWIVPAFWMIVPLVITSGARSLKLLRSKSSLAYSLLFVAAAFLVGRDEGRSSLLRTMGGRPGALAELTLWEPLVKELRAEIGDRRIVLRPRASVDCAADSLVLAAPRWFWVAHLAFALPSQPEVISLDGNAPSYYHQRNNIEALDGCRVLLVGDRRHLTKELVSAFIDEATEKTLMVPDHMDVEVVVIQGWLRGKRGVEAFPLLRGI